MGKRRKRGKSQDEDVGQKKNKKASIEDGQVKESDGLLGEVQEQLEMGKWVDLNGVLLENIWGRDVLDFGSVDLFVKVLDKGNGNAEQYDYILGTIVQDDEEKFETFFVTLIENFQQLDCSVDSSLKFLTFCVGRMDCKQVRTQLMQLVSHRLWLLVSDETLERQVKSATNSYQNKQWEKLKEKPSSCKFKVEEFWGSLFTYVLEKRQALDSFIHFLVSLLSNPLLCTFLPLLLKDVHIIVRLKILLEGEKTNDSSLQTLERLLYCGGMDDEDVYRMWISKGRLFQRVCLRHFENELKHIYLLSVQKSLDLVVEKNALKILNLDQLKKLCNYLGIYYDSGNFSQFQQRNVLSDSKEQLLQVLVQELTHVKPLVYEHESKLIDPSSWISISTNSVGLEEMRLNIEKLLRNRKENSIRNSFKLQYLCENQYIRENLLKFYENAKLCILHDLYHGIMSLDPSIEDTTGKIVFRKWSNIAVPCDQVSAKSVSGIFYQTPTPVLAEWAGLSFQKLPVLLVELKKANSSNSIQLGLSYFGIPQHFNTGTGSFEIKWFSSEEEDGKFKKKKKAFVIHKNEGSVYVLVRVNKHNDLPRKVGFSLLQGLKNNCNGWNMFPPKLKPIFLGKSRAEKCVDLVKLVAMNGWSEVSTTLQHEIEKIVFDKGKTLIVTQSENVANEIVNYLQNETPFASTRIRMADLNNRNAFCLQRRLDLLEQVQELARGLLVGTTLGDFTCESAMYFYRLYVQPEIDRYVNSLKENSSLAFPFAYYFDGMDDVDSKNEDQINAIHAMFEEVHSYRTFELIHIHHLRLDYILHGMETKILVATNDDLGKFCEQQFAVVEVGSNRKSFKVDRLVLFESDTISDMDALLSFSCIDKDYLKDCVLVGDDEKGYVRNDKGGFPMSVFEKMQRLGFSSSSFVDRKDDVQRLLENGNPPGFFKPCQFIHVEQHQQENQNVMEAEYIVAIYQYMILLGYPNDKISILCSSEAQKLLVIDIFYARTRSFPMGFPKYVSTFNDPNISKQDYLLVSLVGDSEFTQRKLLVPFKIAKNGLFLVGNRNTFTKHPTLSRLLDDENNRLQLCFSSKFENLSEKKKKTLGSVFKVESLKDLGGIVFHMQTYHLLK